MVFKLFSQLSASCLPVVSFSWFPVILKFNIYLELFTSKFEKIMSAPLIMLWLSTLCGSSTWIRTDPQLRVCLVRTYTRVDPHGSAIAGLSCSYIHESGTYESCCVTLWNCCVHTCCIETENANAMRLCWTHLYFINDFYPREWYIEGICWILLYFTNGFYPWQWYTSNHTHVH